jgi:cytochrome c peroxidase
MSAANPPGNEPHPESNRPDDAASQAPVESDADRPSDPSAADTHGLGKPSANASPALAETYMSPRQEFPTLPNYSISSELGRGAMGVVYKAQQVSLKRTVALKMILTGANADEEYLSRFQAEAEAVAQLHHPNILHIYEIGEHDGLPFFSMEFVDGGCLSDKVNGKAQPAREAVETVKTLARAIHVAHVQGIVHRDLKPANILVGADGLLKITDFGLAKKLGDQDSTQTRAGSIMGTPMYMAPEQAAGVSREITPAADTYSLGAMLYELLTGQPPFSGESVMDTLHKVRTEDPVPPTRIKPKLHRDLETICLKCLEKDPAKRFESAESLADDLQSFLDSEPIDARPTGKSERCIRWMKRRPAMASMVALVTVIIPIGLIALFVILQQAEKSRQLETDKTYEVKIPVGLESFSVPSDNPMTVGKVKLGKQLFFDKRLSLDNTVSCATCHDPAAGWSNAKATATGVGGQVGDRGSPTIINAAYQYFLFWDGRAPSLEAQSTGPIFNPIEMGMPSEEALLTKLNAISGYREQFQRVFGTDVTVKGVADSIVAFERTILSGNAPFDRARAGQKDALTEAGARGMDVFFNAAHCSACHSGPNFTDGAFHNIGVASDVETPDQGREKVTGRLGDRSSFKTPTLREIARTAPYMHDGSMKSLEQIVEYYDKGGLKNPQLDEEMYPLELNAQQKRDLVVFLKEGLSSPEYPFMEAPPLPE